MVNLRETKNIKTEYKKLKRCADIFAELPLTRALHSRDSVVKTIKTIQSSNFPLINFPLIENKYQDFNQTGTAKEQKLRQEAAVTGELKGKHEC